MTTPQVTEEEITARARQLADEQGPGWEIVAGEVNELLRRLKIELCGGHAADDGEAGGQTAQPVTT